MKEKKGNDHFNHWTSVHARPVLAFMLLRIVGVYSVRHVRAHDEAALLSNRKLQISSIFASQSASNLNKKGNCQVPRGRWVQVGTHPLHGLLQDRTHRANSRARANFFMIK